MIKTSRPMQVGQWTESATKVMKERYLARDAQGRQETPEDMCWRVATAVAAAEEQWGRSSEEVEAIAEEFYNVMVENLFLPNSPTLMNAGTNNGLGYSACFVLPVEDSIEGIFEAIKYAALIHKSGGGTGFAFSRLLGGYIQDVRLPGMLPLIGSVGVIIGATVIASALPAVRAARVDVMQALRSD